MLDSDFTAVSAYALEHLEEYEDIYRRLHQEPELSKQEHETASFVAQQLRKLNMDGGEESFNIITGIGGNGVVGVLKNGMGKTVLLRAELDALPVQEDTGLEYSSRKVVVDERDGSKQPVMHACGHDMHIASLLCTARALSACRKHWSGTLVVLFQPSEEDGAGAQAMVAAGLYDPARFAVPIPDIIMAGHLMPMRAGRVATRVGVVNSAVQSIQVTIYGQGGHGARPHTTIDPVVVSSSIVMKLQTIVSRETAPQDSVVITVGSIHAGTAENIISDHAVLKINMRALSQEGLVRTHLAVKRVIEGECHTFRCPRSPQITPIGSFPLLYNTPTLTRPVIAAFGSYFGQQYYTEASPSLGAEDLCNLGVDGTACCFWNIGCIDPDVWDRAESAGRLHEISGIAVRPNKSGPG
jgi:amidohydrolase